MNDRLNAPDRITSAVLDWYDANRRDLLWRAAPGETADPYRVWLSEVMLQQTTVAAVARYYAAFTTRWPTVDALAAAPDDDILKAWAGLGYYARARNLIACARVVANDLGGRFPETEEGLRALPGIGAYTAAAIAAIAFDRPATVVDGNVERVVARLGAVEEPLPGAKKRLKALAGSLTPDRRPGDFAQGMMDLGATVCAPRRPDCGRCPVSSWCLGHARGVAASLPRKAPKPEKPVRYGIAFWVERADGAVLLRRRPPKGLLGGMTEVPSTDWRSEPAMGEAAIDEAPVVAEWTALTGEVRHTFTHFHLRLSVWAARVGTGTPVRANAAPERCFWVPRRDVGAEALPTVMRKVAAAAQG